ncbi:MAG: diphosphomevalonate decarboxylase [Candidatus Micrarchaeota archaeon]|nr:diphosphomevalonate decarboxylase [Candidatus Micrarchaeota archaeon]
MPEKVVTAIGTPNIALVKYWGKRNNRLNLPMNSSLSMTLDESLNTKTSILFSKRLKRDTLYINGEKHDLEAKSTSEKIFLTKGVLDSMRQLGKNASKALIVSNNSFPTSSGLASSASGAAALVFAASHALDLGLSERQMSIFARRISGSASRSIMGGFVKWNRGEEHDGSDSYAEQIASQSYWPEVIDLVSIFHEKEKKISSSVGHDLTLKKSKLYFARPEYAENHVKEISEAIQKKDFETLAEITMQDSNNMHATMLDTYPPIIYLNEKSRDIIYAIHSLNESEGKNIAAYTFDAGPNAQVITLRKYSKKVTEVLKEAIRDARLIEAGQGSGPRLLGEADSLISEATLQPK